MFYNFLKRIYDITFAVTFMIATIPIWLVAILGIRVSSKGPIFYRAQRIGKDRKKFTMYKFRSMHIDDEAVEKSFIADEKRMFAFGRFLRKTKIDEFPQVINILLGQMSVVGYRPPSSANVEELYQGKYMEIFNVKPGLTSPASIYDYTHGELFVSDNDEYIRAVLPVKLQMELIYSKNRNFIYDFFLTVQTAYYITMIILGKKSFNYTKEANEAINALLHSNSQGNSAYF